MVRGLLRRADDRAGVGSGTSPDTPGDFIAVLLFDRSTEIFSQNDVETVVRAGAAALWDSVRPSACFSAATLAKRTMFVPRATPWRPGSRTWGQR